MKKFTLLFALVLTAAITYAQSVISVQHGTTTTLYNTFNDAVAGAQNGDAIYLPGGLIFTTGEIIINKKLLIFGAGYRSDSSIATQPTILNINFTFNAGAEGSLLTGVLASNQAIYINCNNVTITRTNFSDIEIAASGITIEENILGGINGNNILHNNVLIRKNVIYYQMSGLVGCYFLNNIFLFNLNNNPLFYTVDNCSFSNNIICNSYSLFYSGGSVVSFTNNLFTKDFGYAGNKVQPIDSIFTKYTTNAVWDLTQNFKLKTGCKGIKAGTDGTDVGIYGTGVPFKSSAFPYNPHIQSVSIPASTGTDGKLNISITVAAQNQ